MKIAVVAAGAVGGYVGARLGQAGHEVALVARGAALYARYCGTCHGDHGQSRGVFPDLRYSSALHSADLYAAVVREGVLSDNGMAGFGEALSPDEAEATRHYIIAKANEGPTGPFGGPPPPPPAPPSAPPAIDASGEDEAPGSETP